MASQEPFQPNLIGGKSMLSAEQVQKIAANFPIHLQLYDWQLVFSTAVHGFSLDNLYRLMEKVLNLVCVALRSLIRFRACAVPQRAFNIVCEGRSGPHLRRIHSGTLAPIA